MGVGELQNLQKNLGFPKAVGEKNGKRHRCRPQMEKPRG